ncbi:MAG TPA: TolC family protein [Thermoanaerobaculia bacterium]|nr:TolC family protein [Thermoanaerobaculia bacterium]
MTAVRRLITIFMLSLAATALFAQETTPASRATEPVSAETDRDANDARALRLTLDGALNTALQQNLGVQLQTYDFRITDQNLRARYGIFDFFTDANIRHSYSDNPTTNPFQPSGSRTTSLGAGLTQLLPTGGDYSVRWDSSRSTVAGGGTFVNPQYGNGLDFSFNQPLMRDFGIDVTRRGITVARNNLGISEEAFRTAVMDTVSATEQAYLDLVYARRNVDVVKESLFLARDQSRITQIRIDVGASAPLDILQPRVTIATTEEQLIAAVTSVRNAEDRLRALLNLPTTEWDRPIVPTDNVAFNPITINFQQAVQQALANRPEIAGRRLLTENAKVQALYTRNQVLPLVDFTVNYGLAGLAGRSAVLNDEGDVIGSRSTPYTDTFEQIAGLDFPTWNVGFNFALPILNIGARADARAAELALEQSTMTQSQTEQNVAVEVRSAARAVDAFAQTIAATRAARDAAERNVDAERKRYENGMTTNFQVLEVQQQLSDARVRELQAVVGYNKAVAAFHRAVGDILDVHNIRLSAPEKVEEPTLGRWLDRYNWLNYGSRVQPEEAKANDSN